MQLNSFRWFAKFPSRQTLILALFFTSLANVDQLVSEVTSLIYLSYINKSGIGYLLAFIKGVLAFLAGEPIYNVYISLYSNDASFDKAASCCWTYRKRGTYLLMVYLTIGTMSADHADARWPFQTQREFEAYIQNKNISRSFILYKKCILTVQSGKP